MKIAMVTLGICLLIPSTWVLARGEGRERKLVTRIDLAILTRKGHGLAIKAFGMGRTPSDMGRAGRILRRNPERGLNKDGLLEYDMVFNAVSNYSGFKMKSISASYSERTVPEGTKGVRIFGELNQYDVLLPEVKQKKSMLPFGKKHKEDKASKAAEQEAAGSITGPSPHP
jgi:hypothetical protein